MGQINNYMAAFLLVLPLITQSWTKTYIKKFNDDEFIAGNSEIIYQKVTDISFTQLLFSWNAFRPIKGYFSFSMKVQEESTGHWSTWHEMAHWGNQKQCSFKTEKDAFAQFFHVRLEMLPNKNAKAFSFKIKAHDGAKLSLLKLCSVTVSDLSQFQAENSQESLPSIYISGVPLISQFELDHPRNDGLCSPTSCAMLVSYLLKHKISATDFAELSYDYGLDKYGSWPFNMAHAFEKTKGTIFFAVTRLPSFVQLHQHLLRGIPVVVSVRGQLSGAPKVYANGHLLMVVGYNHNNKSVICHDPAASASMQVIKTYKLHDFLLAWERSHRLAYIAEPEVKH